MRKEIRTDIFCASMSSLPRSGSIAAYKSCLIVRGLVKAGAEVRCVMTENAAKFVSPLTLAALSQAPVNLDMFDPSHWEMAHLETATWADRVLIAPATDLSVVGHGGADHRFSS